MGRASSSVALLRQRSAHVQMFFLVVMLLSFLSCGKCATTTNAPVSVECNLALQNVSADPWSLFQMIQGSGKYPSDWGYIDTCEMTSSAHYCFAQMQLDAKQAKSLVRVPFDYLKQFNLPPFQGLNLTEIEIYAQQNFPSYLPSIEWGLCVPKACGGDDVKALFIEANNASLFTSFKVNCLPTPKNWTAGPIIMITLTSLLGLMAIIGTSIDLVKRYWYLFTGEGNHPQHNGEYQFVYLEEDSGEDEMHTLVNPGLIEMGENGTDEEKEDFEKEGIVHNPMRTVVNSIKEEMEEMKMEEEYAKAAVNAEFADFARYDDVEYLKEKNPHDDEELGRNVAGFFMSWSVLYNMRKLLGPSSTQRLDSLSGMRVISMGWVILAHTLSFLLFTNLPENIFYLLQSFQDDWEWQIVLSGFFAVDTFFFIAGFLVSFLLVKELVLKGRVNWFHYYIHRIWRICPVYFFVFLFYWQVTPLLSDGPKWKDDTDMKYCDKYWWANLLYIQNLIPWNFSEECMGWAWYLAVDFQYYILSPLLIYPFYKKQWLGWLIVGVLLAGCLIVNLALAVSFNMTYWYGNNFGQSDFFNQIYTKPWARAYPYLIGVMLGYLLSTRREQSVNPPNWVLVLLTGAAFAVMGAVVFGPSSLYAHSTAFEVYGSWSEAENISFIVFSRLGWGLALATIVYVCVKSPRSIVQSFLAHPIWTPLARVTFSAYLIHPILLTGVYSSFARPYHYSRTSFAYFYVGHVLFAYILGLICFLLVERPLMNLEKFLLPQRHKKHGNKEGQEKRASIN